MDKQHHNTYDPFWQMVSYIQLFMCQKNLWWNKWNCDVWQVVQGLREDALRRVEFAFHASPRLKDEPEITDNVRVHLIEYDKRSHFHPFIHGNKIIKRSTPDDENYERPI